VRITEEYHLCRGGKAQRIDQENEGGGGQRTHPREGEGTIGVEDYSRLRVLYAKPDGQFYKNKASSAIIN